MDMEIRIKTFEGATAYGWLYFGELLVGIVCPSDLPKIAAVIKSDVQEAVKASVDAYYKETK